jgi:hypothetical protein
MLQMQDILAVPTKGRSGGGCSCKAVLPRGRLGRESLSSFSRASPGARTGSPKEPKQAPLCQLMVAQGHSPQLRFAHPLLRLKRQQLRSKDGNGIC